LSRGRSPLEFLHSIYQRTPEQLAKNERLYMRIETELIVEKQGNPAVLLIGELPAGAATRPRRSSCSCAAGARKINALGRGRAVGCGESRKSG
jgi:hypothetical protein